MGGFQVRNKGGAAKNNKNLKTRAVIFVEQTPRGELAVQIREQLKNLEGLMGFKLRVVERTGRNILSNFQQTNTWKGLQCGREECITCNQEGEELPNCTRAGVVYESICVDCNPGATKKGELENMKDGNPSLYVGESSRSIQERAGEHWGAARRGDEDNHMVRHQAQEHEGRPPRFHFKVISSHKTALSRQIREAVRIRRRGGAGSILNSRAEFNRCHIPRLVVEIEDEDAKKSRLAKEQKDQNAIETTLEDMDKNWLEDKTRSREQADKKRERVPELFEGEQKPKRIRKMKYDLLSEDWGSGEVEDKDVDQDQEDGGGKDVVPTL